MSLYEKPKSILDVPPPSHTRHLNLDPSFDPTVNTSEAALHRTLTQLADHHEKQFESTALTSGLVIPEAEEVAGDFPRHVHSTTKDGHFIIARDEEHHTELLRSDEWSDEPREIVPEEKEQ